MQIIMRLPTLFWAFLYVSLFSACAQTSFTPLEQQKIAIETPGLFERADAFTVDFSIYGDKEYCFPLPVGKVVSINDNTMDIETTKGDAVKAMFSGVVRMSREHPQFGYIIVIRHANGLETVYGLNRENRVKVGQNVKAGQTIAIVGGTEDRTLCRFSIMVNGGRINPETIIASKAHRLLKQKILFEKKGFSVKLSVIEHDPWVDEQLKADEAKAVVNSDPFGGANKFTLDLSAIQAGQWYYPLPGAKVISPYGTRGSHRHSGVDIKTKPNDNILAVFDGIVTMSQPFSGYGNCIILRHANGLETLYSHNSKNLVKVGDHVKAGQVIALTGRTGRASTEHLHFEVRVNGHHYDPQILFDHSTRTLKSHRLTFTKNGGISIK
jgi:murein DD-endopeptidase MepM/ murein hydrolase activator NlpD